MRSIDTSVRREAGVEPARTNFPDVAPAISSLFPEEVVCVTATPDMEGAPLFPEEEAFIDGAVAKRRREYVLGRASARAALARLGIPDRPLRRDRLGAPVWPAGVVGSITHCEGFCGAVVARRGTIVGLGIDAEPAEPLPCEIVPRVCTVSESNWAQATPARPGADWYRLIFSAKESVYKACYPLVRRVLEFAEVEIAFEPTAGQFAVRFPSARLAAALEGRELQGRFAHTCRHILTGVVVVRAG